MGGDASRKRRREESDELRRIAEIVLVLSAMGKMRGGKEPTAAEKALVFEARGRLAGVCESVKPCELFTKEAVMALLEDLGLNRSNGAVGAAGFQPQKMSIAEKIVHAKRKMEEANMAAVYSSQHRRMTIGLNGVAQGAQLHGSSKIINRPNMANVPAAMNYAHASPMKSQIGEMQTVGRPAMPSAFNHAEASHGQHDMRSNSQSYFGSLKATPALVREPFTRSEKNKTIPNQMSIKPKAGHEMQASASKSFPVQVGTENMLVGLPASQAATFVQAANLHSNHNDICKKVQLLLQQKASARPTWVPPSMHYVNAHINCQLCKVIITDTHDVLVCDACEKGTHLKCNQSFSARGIPKAEWHCPTCMIASSGKHFPPKYGKVTRTIGTRKHDKISVGTQKHTETSISEDGQQNADAAVNGETSAPNALHTTNTTDTHGDMPENVHDEEADLTSSSSGKNMVIEMSATFSAISPKEEDDAGYDNRNTNAENLHIQESGVGTKLNDCASTSVQQTENVQECLNAEDPRVVNCDKDHKAHHFEVVCGTVSDGNPKIENLRVDSPNHLNVFINTKISELTKDRDVESESNGQATEPDRKLHQVDNNEMDSNGLADCKQQHESDGQVTESDMKLHEIDNLEMDSNGPVDCSQQHEPDGQATESDMKLHNIDNHEMDSNGPVDSKQQHELSKSPFGPCMMSSDADGSLITSYDIVDTKDEADCRTKSVPTHSHSVEWIGDAVSDVEGKAYYSACRINNQLYNIQDHVLISLDGSRYIPAKIESLWENKELCSKFALVNPYFHPIDVPDTVTRLSDAETCEVYSSDRQNVISASSILGPCEVLTIDNSIGEHSWKSRLADENNESLPIYICRWKYNEYDGVLQQVSS